MPVPEDSKRLLRRVIFSSLAFISLEACALFLLPDSSHVARGVAAFSGVIIMAPVWMERMRQDRARAQSPEHGPRQ